MNLDSLKKYEFFRLPPQVIFTALIVLVMGTSIALSLVPIWETRVDYGFGFIMPIFCIYVLYDRWPKISAFFAGNTETTRGKTFAFFLANAFFGSMLFCALVLFAIFSIIKGVSNNWADSSVFPMTFGFSFAFFALAFFSSSKNSAGQTMPIADRLRYTALFTFPAFAWIISAPMFQSLESTISLFLLSKVAAIVRYLMDAFGFLVELKGNSLCFPNGSVGVADACSGIRSLTACLFAGSFLAAVFLDKFWKKFALVGLSMCFAFLNNLIRALFLSIWAYENGPDSISGFVHDAAGYFVLGATVVELLMLIPAFQFKLIPDDIEEKYREQSPEQKSGTTQSPK